MQVPNPNPPAPQQPVPPQMPLEQDPNMSKGSGRKKGNKLYACREGEIEGCVTTLRNYEATPETNNVIRNGCVELWKYSVFHENHSTIVEAGGIETVVSCMRNYPTDAHLQGTCCAILRYLVMNHDSQYGAAIILCGGVEMLLAAISNHPYDKAVVGEGLPALYHLSQNSDKRVAVIGDMAMKQLSQPQPPPQQPPQQQPPQQQQQPMPAQVQPVQVAAPAQPQMSGMPSVPAGMPNPAMGNQMVAPSMMAPSMAQAMPPTMAPAMPPNMVQGQMMPANMATTSMAPALPSNAMAMNAQQQQALMGMQQQIPQPQQQSPVMGMQPQPLQPQPQQAVMEMQQTLQQAHQQQPEMGMQQPMEIQMSAEQQQMPKP